MLLHETLTVFQSIKKITLLFGEKIAGVILYVIAQFAFVSRSGIYESGYNVTRAANLKAVAFAGVLGGEDNDDRADLIVEKLDRPIPRDLGLEKTLVEHQRWRLAKPRKPGLTANLSLDKRGLRHFINPRADAGPDGGIRRLDVGIDVSSVEPKAQPVGRRLRRLALALVLGRNVSGECLDFALGQRVRVNQHLGKRSLVGATLDGGSDSNVLRRTDVAEPFAIVAPT